MLRHIEIYFPFFLCELSPVFLASIYCMDKRVQPLWSLAKQQECLSVSHKALSQTFSHREANLHNYKIQILSSLDSGESGKLFNTFKQVWDTPTRINNNLFRTILYSWTLPGVSATSMACLSPLAQLLQSKFFHRFWNLTKCCWKNIHQWELFSFHD